MLLSEAYHHKKHLIFFFLKDAREKFDSYWPDAAA
jgi:hypothetical protein